MVRFLYIVLFVSSLMGQSVWEEHTDSTRVIVDNWNSFLTEEERLFYWSEYLPFSLAEKGRLSTGSWRGLPPEALSLQWDGMALENPITGFWNFQLLPRFRSQRSTWGIAPPVLRYAPFALATQPRTVLTHFLDFIMNLSLIDIDFTRQYSKNGQIWLGGHNFVRQGSEFNNYSQIQTTSYFGQFIHRLAKRWQLQGRYFQAHDDFNLAPESPLGFTPAQLKERVIFSSLALVGQMTTRDSSGVRGFVRQFTDVYRENRVEQRRYLVNQQGLVLFSVWKHNRWQWEIQNRFSILEGNGNPFSPIKETRNRLTARAFKTSNHFLFLGEATAWYNSAYQLLPEGRLRVDFSTNRLKFTTHVFLHRYPHPLPYRTIQPGSFQPLEVNAPATLVGGDVGIQIYFSPHVTIRFTGFTNQYSNFAQVGLDSLWTLRDVTNHGATMGWRLEWRFIQFWGNATYNANWQNAFAPRWHGVGHIQIQFPLFKGALKIRGIGTLNYFGRFYPLKFYRLLRTFTPLAQSIGPYPLADFRLFASIKSLTLYFIWENMLSTDYQFVEGTKEYLRLFRLGVRWTLWN